MLNEALNKAGITLDDLTHCVKENMAPLLAFEQEIKTPGLTFCEIIEKFDRMQASRPHNEFLHTFYKACACAGALDEYNAILISAIGGIT